MVRVGKGKIVYNGVYARVWSQNRTIFTKRSEGKIVILALHSGQPFLRLGCFLQLGISAEKVEEGSDVEEVVLICARVVLQPTTSLY